MRYAIALIATLLVGDCSLGALNGTDSADDVVSLRPSWVFTQLRVLKADKAVISFCGGEFSSCESAKRKLTQLTILCSNVVLGIIDVGKLISFPHDVYEDYDPELMLFWKREGEDYLERFTLKKGTANLATIAIALCPKEIQEFGISTLIDIEIF